MRSLVTADEVHTWRTQGFLALDRPVVPKADLEHLRALLMPLVDGWSTLPTGHAQDLGTPGPDGLPSVPEVTCPSRLQPRLLRAAGFARLRRVAGTLLDDRPLRLHFDHLVAKPPGAPATAWHQDVAFDPGFDIPMATLWLPFISVSSANGAMQFIPASHRGAVLDHVAHGRHGQRALIDVEVVEKSVTCPIPAGALCAHMARTLHASVPNTTDDLRLAWVMKFVPDDRPAWRRAVADRRARRNPVSYI